MTTMTHTYDTRHGGAYDRGSADAYYGRPALPHYFVEGTYTSRRVDVAQMTADEIAAYHAGYADTESEGFRKEW
jgi:hypothetical protein